MIIYPAIDIRDGKCVRLVEGDFDRETVFGADPVRTALRFQEDGADWIHMVDLDGARDGAPHNQDVILRVREALSIRMQVGGGIRTAETLASYLDAGIDRVVLGTAAYRDPDLVRSAAEGYPGTIAVGIDARDGKVAGEAWLEQTDHAATDLASSLKSLGVHDFIYTDIHRDGTLTGPNLDELGLMQQTLGSGLIASGGISSLADLQNVAAIGVDGVIVGRALYDGRFSLIDALALADQAAEVPS